MPDETTTSDAIEYAKTANAVVQQAATVAGQIGATGTQKTLQQVSLALAAGVSAGVTGAGIGAVVGGASFAGAIGAGAALGSSCGPIGAAVGVFVGCMVAIGKMYSAGAVEDLPALAERQHVARVAALEVQKQLAWLEAPEHLPQLKAAIISGWYTTAVDVVSTQLLDSDWGPGSSASKWYAAHSDPLAAFPAPASVRDALRLTMARTGLFVGTPLQIADVKAKLRALRLSHPALKIGIPKSRYAAVNALQTFAQMGAPKYSAALALGTIAQLSANPRAAVRRAPPAPKKSTGPALLVAGILAAALLV